MISYTKCDSNDIFGIKPTELPMSLLAKIKFEKLVELSEVDPRAEQLVCTRLHSQPYNVITTVARILMRNKNRLTLLKAYNKYIENLYNCGNPNRYILSSVIEWSLLNNDNKIKDINNWLKDYNSITTDRNIDFGLLLKIDPSVAEYKAKEFLNMLGKYEKAPLLNLIKTVSQPQLNKIFEVIFTDKYPNEFKAQVLRNPQSPEKYTLLALRIIANKGYFNDISAHIDNDMLAKLPSITRLKVLEVLMQSSTNINIDEEQLRLLLFSSLTRYPQRVEQVVKRFQFLRKQK